MASDSAPRRENGTNIARPRVIVPAVPRIFERKKNMNSHSASVSASTSSVDSPVEGTTSLPQDSESHLGPHGGGVNAGAGNKVLTGAQDVSQEAGEVF